MLTVIKYVELEKMIKNKISQWHIPLNTVPTIADVQVTITYRKYNTHEEHK